VSSTPALRRLLRLTATGALCSGLALCAALPASAAPPAPDSPSPDAPAPAPDAEPAVVDLGVADELALLERGATTSVALVQRHLDRIAAYDGDPTADPADPTSPADPDAHPGRDAAGSPGLAAIVTTAQEALATAATLDAERAAGTLRGPLHGVPVVVKDNYATADMPTSAGSVALRDYRTAQDATAVQRLRDAGAIVLAKANTSEFAWHGTYTLSSVRGRTANPYDRANSASGSSGGTAAAVAAGYAPAGLGTDSCGSIVGPSAHQSLVGLRPTRGLVSTAGVVPLSPRQDAAGPMATTVADVALLLQVVAGRDPADPLTVASDAQQRTDYVEGLSTDALRGARIGYVRWHHDDDPERPGLAETTALVDQAVRDLEAQGAEVVEVPDLTREYVSDVLVSGGWIDMRASIDRFLADTDATWPEGLAARTEPVDALTFSDVVADGRSSLTADDLATFLDGVELPAEAYDAAVAAQEAGMAAMDRFFVEHDLDALAMATSATSATPEWAGTTYCDLTANTGVPAVSVPAGFTSTGAAAGLQLVAPRHHDAALLSMAYAYEQATRHRVAPSTTPELPRSRPAAQESAVAPAAPGRLALGVAITAVAGTAVLAATGLLLAVRRRRRR